MRRDSALSVSALPLCILVCKGVLVLCCYRVAESV